MRRLWPPSSDSWTVGVGFDMDLDFCVWLLERDGLRVPPFDQHPDGTGELRALGMNAENWSAWFHAVALAPDFEPAPFNLFPSGHLFPDHHPRHAIEPLRRRLHDLRETYGPVSNQRRTIEPNLRIPNWVQYHRPNLYQVLRPYHQQIPAPFIVRIVRYVTRVDALIRPSHVVLGFDDLPKPDAYVDSIVLAADALVRGV